MYESAATSTIVFNVGGRRFETYSATIEQQMGYKWFLQMKNKCVQTGICEYFIDRNSDVFSCILDYCRTGKLHVKHNLCGPVILGELQFWDLSPSLMQSCCWAPFTTEDNIRHAGIIT